MAKYTNPIISGSYPDPSICRSGETYYMVHSSFEYFPGIPLLKSRDLVHWKQVGYVLDRRDQLNLKGIRSSGGIYAPTIRYFNGTFYVVSTLVDGGGNFLVTTKDPEGLWSDPIWIDDEGIDPSLFFDENGTVYYTRHVGAGDGYIGQAELDILTGRLKSPLQEIWSGTGDQWPEGPHLYKIGKMYYLLIAEGGTGYQHMITVARSEKPMGPFYSNPANPVLSHRDLPDHPFQCLGHADFVETPDGWWTVFLGVRKNAGHLGRETFLAALTWDEKEWPVINHNRPIPETNLSPQLSLVDWQMEQPFDNFVDPVPGDHWNFIRNPVVNNYSLNERSGYLRLYGSPATLSDCASPTFIGRRQSATTCTFSTVIDFLPVKTAEEAGIAVRADDANHLDMGIRNNNGRSEVFLRCILKGMETSFSTMKIPETEHIELIIEADPLMYNFLCRSDNTDLIYLGAIATHHFLYEEIGTFMGVFLGLYASGNGIQCDHPADFRCVKYEIVTR